MTLMQYVRVNQTGGRIVHIDTPHLLLHEETYADGNIIPGRRQCVVRDPQANTPHTPAKTAEAQPGANEGGCPGCRKPRLAELVAGAYKLFKAIEGKTDVDDQTISERKEICLPCQHNDIGHCQSCGCIIWAKIRAAGDACPEGLWGSVSQGKTDHGHNGE